MKAFITGGRGFVGSHMTRFLADKGIEVTIMARNARLGPHLGEKVRVVAQMQRNRENGKIRSPCTMFSSTWSACR